MYSIVEIKGKQYRVEPGAMIKVDRLDLAKDAAVSDIKVLLHKSDAGAAEIGTPYLSMPVKAKVVEEVRADKVTSVRYKPKSGYIKTHGHRQRYTHILIESIG